MNKVKALTLVSVCLLCLNIVLIWFLVSHKEHKFKHDGPKVYIIERLKFDTEQIKDYENLIQIHKSNILAYNQKISQLKNQLFASITNTNNTMALSDSLINEIGKVQIEIERTHYEHFTDIKELCKPEQQEDFKKLSLDISKLFAPAFLKNEK